MSILAFLSWGPPELALVGVIAVLLFGRRLPEVGKNLGKSLIEFKKGLKGTKDQLSDVTEAVDDVKQAAKEMPEEPADTPADEATVDAPEGSGIDKA